MLSPVTMKLTSHYFLHIIFCINSSQEHLDDECTILEFAHSDYPLIMWLNLEGCIGWQKLNFDIRILLWCGREHCQLIAKCDDFTWPVSDSTCGASARRWLLSSTHYCCGNNLLKAETELHLSVFNVCVASQLCYLSLEAACLCQSCWCTTGWICLWSWDGLTHALFPHGKHMCGWPATLKRSWSHQHYRYHLACTLWEVAVRVVSMKCWVVWAVKAFTSHTLGNNVIMQTKHPQKPIPAVPWLTHSSNAKISCEVANRKRDKIQVGPT